MIKMDKKRGEKRKKKQEEKGKEMVMVKMVLKECVCMYV